VQEEAAQFRSQGMRLSGEQEAIKQETRFATRRSSLTRIDGGRYASNTLDSARFARRSFA
jgi:hypothetical protein